MGAAISYDAFLIPKDGEIKNYLDKKSHDVYAYMGWHGVGISMASKALAKRHRGLFDVAVMVTAGKEYSSPRKLQRKIAEQLGLIDIGQNEEEQEEQDDQKMDMEVAEKIYHSLASRNFLIIIDNLVQVQGGGIKWGMMGIPTPELIKSKIIITTPHFQVISAIDIRQTWIVRSLLERESDVPRDDIGRKVTKGYFCGPGVDNLMKHFLDEAYDVSKTLGIDRKDKQVLNCFFYLCLFQKVNDTIMGMDAKELMKYYVGEGFITTITTSTQQPDGIDDLEGVFRHGEAVLGEMITRYMVEEKSSAADGDGKRILMNSHLWEILDGHKEGRHYLKEKLQIQLEGNMLDDDAAAARWMSLSHNKIQPSIPITSRPRPWCAQQLTTLLLNDNLELKQIPDTFFYQTPNLKVLDLSRTSISSFPSSSSSLVHLRFFKLRQCTNLNILPPSLKHLKQLIILDLHGTPLCLSNSIPSEALEQKTNLRFIDLSHTNIGHSLLSSLLSSLCNLNLERLLLAGSNAFEGPPLLISTPSGHHHQLIRRLSELNISGCYRALKDTENVSFQDLPKLRALDPSHTPITRLSITRCSSLEMVRLQGLTNLKSLHLSSIKIKEFPHEISELTRLEQLHLSDVKYLRKVEWKKLQWLPEKLEWDECGCSSGSSSITSTALLEEQLAETSSSRSGDGGVAFISVNHASIFEGLTHSSPLWEQRFSKFHFYISPCRNCHLKQYQKKRISGRKQPAVVYSKIFDRHLHLPDRTLSMGRRRIDFSRHLEIEGDARLFRWDPEQQRRSLILETVVRRAEVLWLRENGGGSVKSLSDFEVEDLEHLEECWVERCHNMEHLFQSSLGDIFVKGQCQRLWVSELWSLRSVYIGKDQNFRNLKHLHIQCCPKLHTLFPIIYG